MRSYIANSKGFGALSGFPGRVSLIVVLGLFILMFSSCEKEDPDGGGTILPQEGFILTKHNIDTELPAYINIMFQVTDADGKGVDTLVTADFEVLEDDLAVSPTESAMLIRQRENIPYTLRTVLLLDNSASVGANLDEIKNAANALIQNKTPRQEIAIYKFSEDPILVQDFTTDLNDLLSAVNSITLGYATTNLYGAIIEGVSRWEDLYSLRLVYQGFLIALTDGSDTQGSHSLAEALEARGDKKVYTVGLGGEIDPDMLKQIGNAGFFSISDVSDLVSKFTDIQSEMSQYSNSFYWLNYMSPKRGNFDHSIKLTIKNNKNRSESSYINGEFNSDGFYSVYPGIYINPSSTNLYGVEVLTINQGTDIDINVVTYLGGNPPLYEWVSGDETIMKVEQDPNYYSKAKVTAVGTQGQSTTLTVNDLANSLSKTITINII